jgi:hypothetical protein
VLFEQLEHLRALAQRASVVGQAARRGRSIVADGRHLIPQAWACVRRLYAATGLFGRIDPGAVAIERWSAAHG